MFKLFKRQDIPATPPAGGYDSATCRRLLSEHLDYIEKICEKATAGSEAAYGTSLAGEGGHGYIVERPGKLDKDELFIQVVDHLKEDDFRRLREFKGNSSITTYLTAIISRLVVDIVRSRTGRNRAKERAERFGELGRKLYDIIFQRGLPITEAQEALAADGISTSEVQLREMLDEMEGRGTRHQITSGTETAWGDAGELVTIQRDTAEQMMTDRQQQQQQQALLKTMLDGLSGQERLLVVLRFPLDEDVLPLNNLEIAMRVGLTQQQVDRKIRNILLRCREELLAKGLSLDDLL